MNFTFTNILETLGVGFAFRLINQARPSAAYLLNTILPERLMMDYRAENGSMIVRSTMPGLVSTDTPYPPSGQAELSTFLQDSAKVANKVTMSEQALRTLQAMMAQLQLSGASTNEAMVEEVLNFTNSLLLQPHLDVAEYMRGLALANGAIDWTYNGVRLNVDYQIPAGNKLTARTGNDAYAGSASKFWTDVRAQNRLLRNASQIIRIAHPDLVDDIILNTVNAVNVVSNDSGVVVLRKYNTVEGNTVLSSDARDTVTIIKYGLEGEIIDPATPTQTKRVPFWPRTKMVAIATGINTGYVVGAGSRTPTEYELGYTHLAPTVEGSGRPGRWARVYTPESQPWQLVGEAAANLLPVIDVASVARIAIATSDVSA